MFSLRENIAVLAQPKPGGAEMRAAEANSRLKNPALRILNSEPKTVNPKPQFLA